MQRTKKLFLSIFLATLMLLSSFTPIAGSTATAQGATTKISNKTLTLEKGKTKTLKVKGTSKKITWSSNNKKVATVTSKGKVTAKAVGTTTITAKASNKKYTCKVTVVKPENPYLKNAPFKAVEISLEGYSFVMPSDWIQELKAATETSYTMSFTPPEANSGSNIAIYLLYTKEKAPSFSLLQEDVTKTLSLDNLTKSYAVTYQDPQLTISNFTQEEFKANVGSVMKTHCTVNSKTPFEQYIYDFYLDNYFIEIATNDYEKLDLSKAAEYVINSVIAK